jgi:hypothetical protein
VKSWSGLAVVFACLSLDEFCQIHELATAPVHRLLPAGGAFAFAWIIPGIAFVAIIGAIYWRFVFALPARIRWLAITSAAMFVGGAIGCEMIGSYIFSHAQGPSLLFDMEVVVEEVLEMTGVAVWIYTLLCYLAHHIKPTPALQIDFGERLHE